MHCSRSLSAFVVCHQAATNCLPVIVVEHNRQFAAIVLPKNVFSPQLRNKFEVYNSCGKLVQVVQVTGTSKFVVIKNFFIKDNNCNY